MLRVVTLDSLRRPVRWERISIKTSIRTDIVLIRRLDTGVITKTPLLREGGVAAATPLLPEEGWPRLCEAGVVGADGVVRLLERIGRGGNLGWSKHVTQLQIF